MKVEVLERRGEYIEEVIWIKVKNEKQESLLEGDLNKLTGRGKAVTRYVTWEKIKNCRGGYRVPVQIGGRAFDVWGVEAELEMLEKDFKKYPELQ